MSIRIEHANISVRDIEKALRFITTALPEFHIRGGDCIDWLHYGDDDTYISLMALSMEAQIGHHSYQDTGVNHIGIVVDNVDAVVARLEAAGYRQDTGPEVSQWRKRYYFADDDYQQWEFIEYLTEDPALKNAYE